MSKRLLMEEINVKRTKQDEAAIENHVAEASTSHERFQAKDCNKNANDSPVVPDLQLQCVFTDKDESVQFICAKDADGNIIDLEDRHLKRCTDDDEEEEEEEDDDDDSDSSVEVVGVEHPGVMEHQAVDNDDDCLLLYIDTNDISDTAGANEEQDTNDMSEEIDPGDVTEKGY